MDLKSSVVLREEKVAFDVVSQIKMNCALYIYLFPGRCQWSMNS